jgi:hypothetical protein
VTRWLPAIFGRSDTCQSSLKLSTQTNQLSVLHFVSIWHQVSDAEFSDLISGETMTKFRFFLSLLLFLLLFIAKSQEAFAQTLPAKVRGFLNQSYAGWKLHSGDQICKSRAVVSGDFDGNKKIDYAVMFKKDKSGHIIVFLANRTDYKALVLESSPADDMKNSFLTVARKSESYAPIINGDLYRGRSRKLKTDAIVSGGCESSEYLYIYNKGRFKRVFTSD